MRPFDSNGSIWVLIGLYASFSDLMDSYRTLYVFMDSYGLL